MTLAPIILFTFNRPWHTQQVLDALARNKEAKDSILFIYCDGAKKNESNDSLLKIKEVQALIKAENRFKKVIIKIQEKNKGLANSITDGVTEIIDIYKKVIVLEDDIVTSSGFLKYMNDALLFYQNNERVMHISGFMFPHKQRLEETFFFNVPLCWGWATWSRAWDYYEHDSLKLWEKLNNGKRFRELDKFGGDYLSSQLAHNISGKLKTWFVKWHASVLLKEGYTLYPHRSFVDNIGFDNTGVHNKETTEFKNFNLLENISVEPIEIIENKKAALIIKLFYNKLENTGSSKKKETFKKKINNKLRNLFFKIFPNVKNVLNKVNESNRVNIKNSYLGKQCLIYPSANVFNSIIGNYSYIAKNSTLNKTIIGKFCSIGPNLISGWGIHPTNGLSTHPMFYSTQKQNGITLSKVDKIEETKSIIIGNDVFIGMNVTILDGVKIGDGAIIGAGAVVSKDIPPFAIAVGNPIQIIKYRFNQEKIEDLMKIKWWDFEKEDLGLIEKHFFSVEDFIAMILNKNK